MKKFLSKLPVMVSFLVVAVVVLGVYIGLLARPVAQGMNYHYTLHKDGVVKSDMAELILDSTDAKIFKELDLTYNVKFKSNKVLAFSMSLDYKFEKDADKALTDAFDKLVEESKKDEDGLFGETEISYYREGNNIYFVEADPKDSKAYDEEVKALKESEELKKAALALKVNAFTLKSAEGADFITSENLTCTGTIVLTVVLGAVELALIAFSALSVVYFVGSKKKAA